MDACLALAEPDELPSLLRSLTAFELTGMDGDEADEWRRRILALIAFHETGDSTDVA